MLVPVPSYVDLLNSTSRNLYYLLLSNFPLVGRVIEDIPQSLSTEGDDSCRGGGGVINEDGGGR